MSSTLTWKRAALETKTGTTNTTFFTDLVANINSMSADSAYPWVVASSSTAGPMYCVLKPKSGGAGRILFVLWVGAPAGNHAVLLDGAPSLSSLFVSYFPNGNTDTPSNLTAASGTILGNDTDALKVSMGIAVSSLYGASVQLVTAACADGVVLFTANPGSTQEWMYGAGKLVVDVSDNEKDCCFSASNVYNAASSGSWPWTPTAPTAGNTTGPRIITNYTTANKPFYQAWAQTGAWTTQGTPGASADIMLDTSNTEAWFVPISLVGQAKGQVLTLKLRQIAFGPPTAAAFAVYNTTGPVVAAQQVYIPTAGANSGSGMVWLTNFKV